jgi:serine/threonine-protein kinase
MGGAMMRAERRSCNDLSQRVYGFRYLLLEDRLETASSMPALDSEESTSLRSYRLIAEIGRGGMANVYLAVASGHMGFNKLVVIKRTRADLALEGDVQAMFLDEARLAARMNHPNVVQTLEFGEDEGRHFIAMEYLDGQPYSRVLNRLRESMPLVLHVRVIADALAGLHHAHELRDFDGTPLGVVHRDATPHNVFITYDGSIKVVDFGIAKALDSSTRTRTGVVKGKVTFMSPEQARGEPLDRRADVFAAGAMLWEACAGRRMWDMPEISIVHELLYDKVPSLAKAAPQAPPALLRVVERAVAARRDDRYATALEMARDLEAWLATTGERTTARDVGELIAPAFEAERARVRAVIESQLSDLRWTGAEPRATSELPSLHIPGGALAALGAPAPQAQPERELNEHPTGFVPTDSGASLPLRSRRPGGRSMLVPAFVAAAASLAVVLVGAWILVRPAAPPAGAPVASAPPPATKPEEPSPSPPPEAITLSVRGTPAEVRIYLDGVLLSTGPFEGKVMRGTKTRTVRIEAQGYKSKEQEIPLTADLVVAYDLVKADAPKQAGDPGPPRGDPGAPRSYAGPAAPVRPKPQHDIDSDSPYKR